MLTRDADADKAFYPAVFGWVAGRPSFEGAPDSYTVWELAGKPVGGMMQMTDEFFPAEVPPHWSVCFAVADCDGTVAKAPRARRDCHRRADGHAGARAAPTARRAPKRAKAEGICSARATTSSKAAAKRRISASSITSAGRP